MALGFGFNKAKVLASAEKFVQQGKLPNAITEYEKVIKEDPKDLTVLNTIGDLYARVGQNEHAAHYFKKVGEQYAQSGFTVKAIAVYKKLSKLTPNNAEYIMRLAELYTQQGLLNDARAQYMQIADAHLRSGEHNSAARVLQRVLELDPENTATQAKLADLYLKLGRREEALKIYSSAAESLYARGSHDAAKDALSKVITLDPGNPEALLLRGMMAADAGDNLAAVNYLEQVRDIDSRPNALRALLRAQLGSDSPEGADSVAGKLLTLHNDMSGVTTLAEWYLNNGQTANATRLCEMHADRLNAAGPGAVRDSIRQLLQNVKSSPGTPGRTSELVPRSGETAQTAELMEQQAHDCAKRGEYERARDLYKRLAEMEPENALHAQNYRQMLDKLGADSATRILTPEEAAQAFMVEELDENAAVVHQKYDPPTESAIEAALTDAELFVSYNVPSKAIPPLEAALPLAPHDITLNQRLATLYSRAGRFADAAKVCQTLSDIYRELGHEKEAAKYQEATRKYNLRAGVITPAARAPEPPSSPARPSSTLPDTQEMAAEAEPSVKEFSFDIPDHLMTEPEQPPVVPTEIVTEPAAAAEQEFNVQIAPTPGASPEPQEIDISSEWEDMLTVEEQEPEQAVAVKGAMPAQEPEPPVQLEEPEGGSKVCYAVDEKVEEINSLISQQKWDAARAAILKLTETAPEAPEINELMAAVAAGQRKQARAQQASEPAVAAKMEPAPIDFLPPPFAAPAPPAMPEAAQEFTVQSGKPRSIPEIEPLLEIEEEKAPPPPVKKPSAPAAKASAPPPSPPAAASAKTTEDILSDFVLDLEEHDLADFSPRPQSAPEAPAKPAIKPAPAVAAASTARPHTNGNARESEAASVLNDIFADLQEEAAGPDAHEEEDPETHYNLGIAFKEMGLLDEAIGELQKVCHAVDKGTSFSQPIQAYTWLAQCLVDKGAPEAAVRWYQKALQLPGLDDGSRCAIYYDLASAYEAYGDRKSALTNFMEVYGSNIDFRDVASRIKELKS